jgi:hypothetical protein
MGMNTPIAPMIRKMVPNTVNIVLFIFSEIPFISSRKKGGVS